MSFHQLKRAAALLLAGTLAIAGCSGDKGNDGKSCSVQNNGNGTATITCSDGTSATVSNGNQGDPGTPATCTATRNGDGTQTITCSDGSSVVVRDATVDFATMTAADKADLDPTAVVTGVSIPADGRPVISFKVSDRHGNGIKNIVQVASTARFALMKLAPPGVNVSANETWVNYIATSPTSTSSYETPTTTGAVLTDNGNGSYTFRFAKNVTTGTGALAYDASLVHRAAFMVYSSGNPYAPMNVVYDFVPATGAVLHPNDNSKVDGAACLQCHGSFRAVAGGTGAFHGGDRYDVRICAMCHNDQARFGTLSGNNKDDSAIDPSGVWTGNLYMLNGESIFNLPVFIHKIHMGEELTLKGGTYRAVSKPWEVTYPQDVKNCAKCHRTVAGTSPVIGKADNWKVAPSRRACGACHDNISFTSSTLNARTLHSGGIRTSDLTGGGVTGCSGCHPVDAITDYHQPLATPAVDNYYVSTTMSANVNAGWMPAANTLPPGAIRITFDVSSVSTVAAAGGGWNGQMKFKFKKQAETDPTPMDVVFNGSTVKPELMDGFINSPSIYFTFAVPQSGVAAPADWNSSVSATVKNLWKNSGGTLTGPDGSGYYTAVIKSGKIPGNAGLLTGGVGYSYSLSSSPPLTQIDLLQFPYNSGSTDVTCAANVCPGGPITLKPKMGGLVVTAPDVTKLATGHTARRTIVSNAKCNACHEQLGSNPTFHAGQRNDAPTCAFCHTPNRTSSGWSASAKSIIHGIHAGAKREVAFNWHYPQGSYWEVTFPGILNRCTTCHVDPTAAGDATFDFSAFPSVVENLLPSSAATGIFDPAGSGTGAYSPYIVADNVTDYGTGFSFTAKDGSSWDPALAATGLTNLVISPIAAACFGCHDTQLATNHMTMFGATIYRPLSQYLTNATAGGETCLMCHGKGKVAAIQDVHVK